MIKFGEFISVLLLIAYAFGFDALPHSISLKSFLSETNRRTKSTTPRDVKDICASVISKWDVDPHYGLIFKIEQLIERLAREGLSNLSPLGDGLISWTKLVRQTVLKEQRGKWAELVLKLQNKVGLLLEIMETDNFERIIPSISKDETAVADVLRYFVRDANISNFEELRLSGTDIELLIEALKKDLEFEGWLPLWLTVEPSLWQKYSLEYKKARESAERLREYHVNLLEKEGITFVEVNLNRSFLDLRALVPTHHVDIYEGGGSVSYQARLAELNKGIMIPIEVIKYTRGGGIFIADGHSRAYAAYKLGIEEIEVFIVTFTADMIESEYNVRTAGSVISPSLRSIADIPAPVPAK